MVTLVQCAEFQSLSTSTSTSISGANSSVASLSTSVSSAMSGSLSNVNSSVASLSTLTSTAMSGSLSGVNSSVASLSTSTSTGLSNVNSSVASLSTSTATGLSAVNSSVASLSTALTTTTVLPSALAPTAPPAAGEPRMAVNTNGEVFEYVEGTGWVLTAQGYTNLIILPNTAVVPSSTVFCTYTAQRTGVYQIGGSFFGNFNQDPANDGKAYCRIKINGADVSLGVDSILASSGSGDGIGMTSGTIATELNVGDVVTLEVQLFTFQTGLTAPGDGSLSIHAVK